MRNLCPGCALSSVSDSRLARLCCRDITIGIGAQAALKAALKAADESVKAQAAPVKACKAALEEWVKVAEDLMLLLSFDDLANVATRFRRVVVSHESVLNTLSDVDGLVQSIMDRLVPGEPAPGAMSAAPAAPAPAVRLHLCSAAGCKGSFDSVAGTCMVCQAAHCVRCIQPLPAGGGNGAGPAVEHRCNPADVATARYVAASTTACPRCHTAISRISGCAQMLCTHCYAVFDFNTGRETAGIIHNPHFYSLSAELRQKVSDERAARGLSGQASGARNRAAPIACDADAEHDPLCVPFESPIFLALLEARFKDKDRDSVLEAHQLASDYVYRAPRVEEQLHASINFGELRARAARITYLRGGRRIAKAVTMPMTNHPLGYKSESVFVAGLDADGAGDTASASRVYGRFLMTVDTERSKVASRLELMRTYADVAQDQLRLLLVAGSGELPVLLAQVNHLRCKTVALLMDLESEGGSYAKKRRTEARQKAEKAEADLAAALAAAAPACAGGPSLIVASSQPLMQSQPTAAAPQGADESDSGGDDDGGKRPSDGVLDDAAASGSGDEEEGGRNKRARRA